MDDNKRLHVLKVPIYLKRFMISQNEYSETA